MSDETPKTYPIIEGTLAQILGGSLASVIILTLASFKIYVAAGLESSLGTLASVVFYIVWKNLRAK